jgi:hypothetical protein
MWTERSAPRIAWLELIVSSPACLPFSVLCLAPCPSANIRENQPDSEPTTNGTSDKYRTPRTSQDMALKLGISISGGVRAFGIEKG